MSLVNARKETLIGEGNDFRVHVNQLVEVGGSLDVDLVGENEIRNPLTPH